MKLPAGIPGTLWRHKKTGGFYWSVSLSELGDTQRKARPVVMPGERYATKVKRAAVARVRVLYDEITQGGSKAVPRSTGAWIADFQAWNAAASTARQGRYNADVVRTFAKARGIRHVWEISPQQVRQYLHGLAYAPQTIHHHRNALSKFCTFLMASGQLDSNPARHPLVVVPPVRWGLPRYLTIPQQQDALRHFRDNAPGLYRPAIFCLTTGARLNEMAAAMLADIQEGQIRLHSGKASRRQTERLVPVTPRLRRALGETGGPRLFPRRGSRHWCRMMCEATADLPVFGERPGRRAGNQWHLLRSTWATNLARRGVGLWELMRLAGWTCPQTAMRYINLVGARPDRRRSS